jgi:hypothetical protein
MAKQKRGAMPWYVIIGVILAGISAAECISGIFANLALGDGMAMLASIVATVGSVAFLVLCCVYHSTPDITQLPVIAAIVFAGSNLLRMFSASWSYLFFVAPIVLLVLLILQGDWNLWGILAGAAMIVMNLIAGMIALYSNPLIPAANLLVSGRISSLYVAKLLMDSNTMMGIAIILVFLVIPRRTKTGADIMKGNQPDNPFDQFGGNGGFGGGFGGF